jgi:hypothetical protein
LRCSKSGFGPRTPTRIEAAVASTDPACQPRSAARGALLTSASVAVGTLGALALSILFLRSYGASARSDGFFGAFSLYLTAVLFGTSLRIVGPSWSRASGDPHGAKLLGVVLPGAVVIGLALAALSPAFALLFRDAARDVARTSLLILGPCAAVQLYGAAQAAALQLRGRFEAPAVAYAAASLVGVGGFLALKPIVGVTAMPLAFASNAAVLVLAQQASGLPRPARLARRAVARAWVALLAGGAALLAVSAAYAISVALMAASPHGTVTIASYAYYVVSIIYGVTASSVAIVVASGSARTNIVGPFRFALVGMAPMLAVAAAGGATIIGRVLGLSAHLTGLLRKDVVLLLPWAPATGILALAVSVLTLHGRTRLLAGIVVATLTFHTALALLLRHPLGATGPVAALGVTPVVAAGAAVVISGAGVGGALARAIALFGGVAAACVWGPWFVGRTIAGSTLAVALVTAIVGVAAYAVVLGVIGCPEAQVLARLGRDSPPPGREPASSA